MMKKLAISVAVLTFAAGAALAKGGPVNAKPDPGSPTGVDCKIQTMSQLGDISFGSTGPLACVGWLNDNLIKGKVIPEDISPLSTLGLTVADKDPFYDLVEGLGGANTVTFNKKLYGITFIGVHVGGGGSYPGVESTSFYKIDLGTTGVTQLSLNFNASSNIAVFKTGTPPIIIPPTGGPVPEPASWALMIAGFGGVGSLMRRRRSAVA